MLGTIAFERVINELVFKLLRQGYVPGKFKSQKARFPKWMRWRKWFLVPYAITWVVIVWLWIWPLWHT